MPEDDSDPAGYRFLAAVGRGATTVGKGIATAFHAIDPDLRRHAYLLPIAGMSYLVPRPKPIARLDDDGYRPVVLVHGLGGHPGNFIGLKTSLARNGRTRSYVIDFGSAASFDAMELHLRAAIDDIYAANELPEHAQVDIVAHSMGGLITRLAAEDPRTRERIANIVTLGTPHAGSHLARLAATELTLGLRPGSEIMQRLDAQDFWGTPEAPLITALWSLADTVVIPAQAAQFTPGRNIELPHATHYSYLIRPSAWRLIWDLLLS